jgi:solute carrier family 39 (zinc transporter), member 1/2/3
MGIAIRTSYSATSTPALIVQGTLDAVSAGILIYTALVELITPELTQSSRVMKAPVWEQVLLFGCLYGGVAVMALIGRWA